MPQARILIVDDDASLLRAFERSFGKRYAVLTADSGDTALLYLRANPVDVVIADYAMPVMTGVELLRRIAVEHPAIGRLMLTAYADLPEIMELKATELVAAILPKPWERAEVDQAISKAMRLASMRKAVQSMKARVQSG